MKTNNQNENYSSQRPQSSLDGMRVVPRNRDYETSYMPRRITREQMQRQRPIESPTVPAATQPTPEPYQYKTQHQEVHAQLKQVFDDGHHYPLSLYEAPERPAIPIRKSPFKRNLFRTVATMTAVVVVGSGIFAWRGYSNMHKVFNGSTTVAALSSEKVAPELLKGEGDGRVNILLLGVGGAGHDGADLTDTMVVLSVDPVNGKAALLSVPRDMWVKMPVNYYGSYQKINAAYSSGKYRFLGKVDASTANHDAVNAGFASVDQVVSEVLGVSINYHLLVDFKAFQQAIDTVNGVNVDVKEPLYDASMAWENGNNPLLAPAGVQTMNGKTALLFARSRHTSSDFARGERQRQLILALKEKVLTAGTLSNPAKIDSLIQSFGDNVYSDLSAKAATRLFSIMRDIPDDNITSLSFTTAPNILVTTDRVGDISVVRPKAGFNSYADIQTFVKAELRDGYLVKENAGITVVGTTEQAATAQATTLRNFGYNVLGGTKSVAPITETTVIDLSAGKANYTKHYLEERFMTTAVSKIPAGYVVPQGAQFVILVK